MINKKSGIIKHITLLLLLFPFSQGIAQSFPFDCLLVNPNGDVDLYWSLSAFNNVEKYRIYYAASGNNFVVIDSIDNQFITTYHHVGAAANVASRKYYLEAVIIEQDNLFTDTLQTIFLQLDNSNPSWAKLYWNAVHNPLPTGSSSWYKIYREYPQGSWNVVDSTQNLRYFHWPDVCEDSMSFFISIENGDCHSVSNITGGIFKDIEYPDKPVLDSVSVDNNGNVQLGWTASDSSDVAGYIIYRFEGNSIWIEMDTVFGINNTFYTDTTVNACEENREYAIASIDSCGNKSPGTFLTPQRPVFLYPIGFNSCSATDTLRWEPYINASPEIEKYEIYVSENGGPFTKAGVVPAGTLTFVHNGLYFNTDYEYFVRAVYGNTTASSCIKLLHTVDYNRPAFVYLTTADVLPDNTVEIDVHADTSVHNSSWNVYRSEDNTAFQLIGSFSYSDINGLPFNYTDETADASAGPLYYRIDAVDSCGNVAVQTNVNKTIHLTGTLVSEQQVSLQWTAYEGWDEPVVKYRIYRMQGETYPSEAYDSVSGNTFSYDDDISGITIADGRFTYWVQAVQDSGNAYEYRETANSNRVLLQQESKLYFPNAFRPGGVNNLFKPVFNFFGGTDYLFQVYNRWGQKIFETDDPSEGWDGTYGGKPVSMDTYVYRLSYKNVFGETVIQRGTVTVVR